jgi:hypothetical protein
MRGLISPLPNTPSWRGAQLEKSTGTLPLPLPLCSYDFAATKFDEVFSGYQPRQVSLLKPTFRGPCQSSSSSLIPDDNDRDGPRNIG